ncbi:DoxX family protein [Leptospira sp. 201903070]|uniref:DoxX family protein n=1 Tax=Leptospira ainlahdjerensis TaxID=2810033 RepID=A0ABS2U6T0_9LEPT|nr:DoxX family protein [Leptospira ainlahdjerensis]MBM9576078.1 DoxX family protein [Leptospira ainlahdjerensis]
MSPFHLPKKKLILFGLRIFVALIFLQTLFFKFSGAPESVAIFSKLGAEPWGRIGTGVLELIASVLLLIPGFGWSGALLGAGLMSGAILSHLFAIGIEQESDGGFLFILALASAAACFSLLWMERQKLTEILQKRMQK